MKRAMWVAMLTMLVAAHPAEAGTVKAKTKRGDVCKLVSSASRSGDSITYGLVSRRCTANVRRVRALGSVERLDVQQFEQPIEHFFRAGGPIPFAASQTYGSAASDGEYRTRFSFTVVLGRGKWRRSGPNCEVALKNRARDTLKCVLLDRP